jgi:hypothetical protein
LFAACSDRYEALLLEEDCLDKGCRLGRGEEVDGLEVDLGFGEGEAELLEEDEDGMAAVGVLGRQAVGTAQPSAVETVTDSF